MLITMSKQHQTPPCCRSPPAPTPPPLSTRLPPMSGSMYPAPPTAVLPDPGGHPIPIGGNPSAKVKIWKAVPEGSRTYTATPNVPINKQIKCFFSRFSHWAQLRSPPSRGTASRPRTSGSTLARAAPARSSFRRSMCKIPAFHSNFLMPAQPFRGGVGGGCRSGWPRGCRLGSMLGSGSPWGLVIAVGLAVVGIQLGPKSADGWG